MSFARRLTGQAELGPAVPGRRKAPPRPTKFQGGGRNFEVYLSAAICGLASDGPEIRPANAKVVEFAVAQMAQFVQGLAVGAIPVVSLSQAVKACAHGPHPYCCACVSAVLLV